MGGSGGKQSVISMWRCPAVLGNVYEAALSARPETDIYVPIFPTNVKTCPMQ